MEAWDRVICFFGFSFERWCAGGVGARERKKGKGERKRERERKGKERRG